MQTFIKRIVRRVKKILNLDEKHRFYLVRSPPLPDHTMIGPNGHELYCSAFNPSWFTELGIVPVVIVDVGSFDGGDALRFQEAAPEATVITIEADPYRADQVRKALAGTSIEVLECAVAASESKTALYRTKVNGIPSAQGSLYKLSASAKIELDFIDQEEIPTEVTGTTLNRIAVDRNISRISLLHMDIQGAEHDALMGLGDIRPDLIYLEVNAQYEGIKDARSVHSLMRRLHYSLAADLVTDRLYVRSDLVEVGAKH